MSKKIVITIRMDKDQKDELNDAVRQSGLSMNTYCLSKLGIISPTGAPVTHITVLNEEIKELTARVVTLEGEPPQLEETKCEGEEGG